MGQVMLRGIRGATTANSNTSQEIISATRDLVLEMVSENCIEKENIAAVYFSVSPDLNAAFPAEAAREIGWKDVPLFCSVEIDVPHALQKCIRIMMLVNTDRGQKEIKHTYLRDARKLREDLADT